MSWCGPWRRDIGVKQSAVVTARSGNNAPTLTQEGLRSEEEEKEVPLRRPSTLRYHLWLNINMKLLQNESHTHTETGWQEGTYSCLTWGSDLTSWENNRRGKMSFKNTGLGGTLHSCKHLFPAQSVSVVLLLCVLAAFFPSSSISLMSSSTCSTETYPSGRKTSTDSNDRSSPAVFITNSHFPAWFALLMWIIPQSLKWKL